MRNLHGIIQRLTELSHAAAALAEVLKNDGDVLLHEQDKTLIRMAFYPQVENECQMIKAFFLAGDNPGMNEAVKAIKNYIE